MGKKSKRRARPTNPTTTKASSSIHKRRFNSISDVEDIEFNDLETPMRHETEILAVAERDPSCTTLCYITLARAFTGRSKGHTSYTNKKAAFYLHKIIKMYDDNTNSTRSETAMPVPTAIFVFMAFVRIGMVQTAMDIYHNHKLKGCCSLKDVMTIIGDIRVDWESEEDDNDILHVQTVMEDHMDVVLKESSGDDKQNFFNLLFAIYAKLNQNKESRECMEILLEIAERTGNTLQQYAAMQKLAMLCQVMGDYDESMNLNRKCLQLLSDMENENNQTSTLIDQHDMKMVRAGVYSSMGDVIRFRGLAADGLVQRMDAKRAYDLKMKACDLVADARKHDSRHDLKKVILKEYFCDAGILLGDMREFEEGVSFALKSIELPSTAAKKGSMITKCRASAMAMAGCGANVDDHSPVFRVAGTLKLRHYYSLQCRVVSIDDDEINHDHQVEEERACLEDAKRFLEKGQEWIKGECPALWLVTLAQVYYFLQETDNAYRYLVMFLEALLSKKGTKCGGCQQRSGKNAVTKQCSRCNAEYYCSETCQNFHWKASLSGEVCHKLLCPLIAYYRKGWKNRSKKKYLTKGDRINNTCTSNSSSDCDEERDERNQCKNETNTEEILTESCRVKFDQFFESILKHERGKEKSRNRKEWHTEEQFSSLTCTPCIDDLD